MSPPPFRERSSGILLHPTSLPGSFGVGDIGPAAHRFAEFLARAGQRWWQMLPVVPPGGGDSPYDSPSATAGSPLLVSLEFLEQGGWLEPADLASPDELASAPSARYDSARSFREQKLRKAFATFENRASDGARRELDAFSEHERDWLDDYCLFSALSRAHQGAPWTRWPEELSQRVPAALERARTALDAEVRYHRFVQHQFARQWTALRAHCAELGVSLLGDVPMFVSHDSADVWAERRVFRLFENGERAVLAGVPPDYFSADGQLWGNPTYDWEALRASGYAWWIARLRRTLERFDAARLDHFIGFRRAWEVPAGATSAKGGRFVDVPGADFLKAAREAFGSLPFIAEDLGALTDDVVKLRDRFELPGMRVLEFAFASSWREYQPHRYGRRTVVYTGTHDNDTVVGWLESAEREPDPRRAAELRAERARALSYAASDGREAHWDMLRLAIASVADTAIFPIQDVLGLGSSARMNVPGTPSGNWTYRVSEASLSPAIAERLATLCDTYERAGRAPPGEDDMTFARRVRVLAQVARRLFALVGVLGVAGTALAQPPGPAPAAPVDTWGTDEPEAPPLPPAAPPAAPPPCPCGTPEADADLVPTRYTLEGIDVRGNTRTARSVVLRYLPFKPGQLIDANDAAFQLARYRLLGTGFFVEVEFALEKGTRRGRVILVVEVAERNTIVVNDISFGLSKNADVHGKRQPLTGYAGIEVAETNLAGTGITLAGAAAIGENQLGLRARFLDPAFLGTSWMIAGTLLYNDALDFFGNSQVRYADPGRDAIQTDFAILDYQRFGGSMGVGRDLSLSTQVWLHYRLETIDASYPLTASHSVGDDLEPIDFSVIRGRSVLSTVKALLQHDTRDHPFLPTRGWFLTTSVELALLPAALDYDFQKVELRTSKWWRLPWKQHVLELQFYGGAIAGEAPFFEQFHVGDFSDFRPDRALGMNFDRRPPPDFLGTVIAEERYGEYAFSLTTEYRVPLYRGRRSIYGIDVFASGGIWGVADHGTITNPPNGYSGFSRIPVDLTANLGFRVDTSVGGFWLAFANALSFIPEGTSR